MKTGLSRWDTLLTHARIASMRADATNPYGLLDGAVGIAGRQIVFVGGIDDLPFAPTDCANTVIDLAGRLLLPGLIDCHTHLVFGGNRAQEFELRLNGASYEQIAKAGGGIVSTVRATREISEDALFAASLSRAQTLRDEGVTTVEIKSGYGLDFETERKMLRVARRIGEHLRMTVSCTYLGMHALPPEYQHDRAEYLRLAIDEWLPALHAEGLVDAVDAFCERIAFSVEETERLFQRAASLGLPVKLHADQLSDGGGAALVARYHGWSADHVEYSQDDAVRAMAAHQTVATLLPGSFYNLRETKMPPIDAFRRERVAMAVSTDLNPGTSPLRSLLHAANQACVLFRLTPAEALAGITRHAAQALGLAHAKGQIATGMDADLVAFDLDHPAELCYWMGGHRPVQRWHQGRAD